MKNRHCSWIDNSFKVINDFLTNNYLFQIISKWKINERHFRRILLLLEEREQKILCKLEKEKKKKKLFDAYG